MVFSGTPHLDNEDDHVEDENDCVKGVERGDAYDNVWVRRIEGRSPLDNISQCHA
jgi:hypothetical protein